MSLKLTIKVVAFFLGHPVYIFLYYVVHHVLYIVKCSYKVMLEMLY